MKTVETVVALASARVHLRYPNNKASSPDELVYDTGMQELKQMRNIYSEKEALWGRGGSGGGGLLSTSHPVKCFLVSR